MKKILVAVFLAAFISDTTFALEKKAARPKVETIETTEEAAPAPSFQAPSKSKAQLGIELLGAGLLYSVAASFRIVDSIAINAGFTFYSVSGSSTTSTASAKATLFGLPVSLSYLIGGPYHHLDLFGGFAPFFASAELKENNSITDRATGSLFVPQVGVGYRYWPEEGGFHFRAALYGMVIGSKAYPWIGFQFGYAFP